MTRKTERCLNCDEPSPGAYCASCGQRNADYRVSLRELLGDALDGLFQLDSRITRTFVPFLFRPGFLTREYCAGRRTRYTSPLRVYLLLSVVYFFTLPLLRLDSAIQLGGGDKPGGVKVARRIEVRTLDVDRPPEVHSGVDWLDRHIGSQLMLLKKLPPDEAKRRFVDSFLSQASKVLFVLLPLFAVLLKILYLRSRRFYIEHLTFALHVHAFGFFLLLLCLIPQVRAHAGLVVLVFFAHLSAALRAVYGQGWVRTLFKSGVLLFLYSIVLLAGVAVTAVVTLAVV
ncbi:MAG: DUF3667 domain-containing protein [Polyangia bacterium]